jgi:hypothetical protein
MVILEDLVPADPLLREIDNYIDFQFIRDKVRHLYYNNNGRSATDLVLLIKMLFIGYFFWCAQQAPVGMRSPCECGLSLVFRVETHR